MNNMVSWVEIPSVDFKRAVKFYNTILKVELEEFVCENEKMACFPTGEGAVIYAKGYNPSKDGVIVSLNSEDDMEGAMQRIEENGGKIIHPKTKIEVEGRGYFAIFIDSEGNRMGLYGNK